MKIRYTPGENGLRGRTFKVEIVALEIHEVAHVDQPILASVKIKYENGKSEWISGQKLDSSTDMVQRALIKRAK